MGSRNCLAIISIVLTLCFSACDIGMRKQSMAELSAFKCYADSLDTLQMERCLHSLLDSDTSHWKADRAVKQRYKDSKDFLWFSNMGVSADADSMLNILRKELPLAGLDTTAFYVPQISGYLHTVHQLAFDSLRTSINEVLPRLDYLLSKAFVRYTVGQRYGFIRPDKLFNQLEHKNNADNEEFAHLFDYETKAPDYEEGFRALTSEQRLDYMRGSRPQGKVYEAFRSMMDSLSDTERRSQLAINMERCRWQLKRPDSDERKVIVNIPTLQLWAVCPDSVLNMRICCGAVTNKTPLLCSEISHFNVNPDWIVPLNIVKSDFLRHAGDSAYFARNRYYIVERGSGDTLNPVQVTADEMQSGRLRIGQKSGAGNSLGHIVFRFPNDFGIYLHDTNNRKAFTYARRTLSHGCIRVQKPLELACFMLPEADEWLTDRLRLSMDLPPLTEQGINYLNEHADDERPLRLLTYQPVSPKIPVYIIYYTVYPNPATSRIEYWPDLYGYDKAIEKELGVLLQKR